MYSKAAKRRAKGGRPPKQGVDRFPCGKIKPSETEREVKSVALEARLRHHWGLNDNEATAAQREEAARQHAGSTLGLMLLDKKITEHEFKTGEAYAEAMCRYYSLYGIPFPSARAQSLFSVKGHDGDVSERRAALARQASNKMMEMERVLLSLPSGPQVKQTVYSLCVMDYEGMRFMPPTQTRLLKRGLKALSDTLGIAKEHELS